MGAELINKGPQFSLQALYFIVVPPRRILLVVETLVCTTSYAFGRTADTGIFSPLDIPQNLHFQPKNGNC